MFVDTESKQELTIANVLGSHPHITTASLSAATPDWLLKGKNNLQRLLK